MSQSHKNPASLFLHKKEEICVSYSHQFSVCSNEKGDYNPDLCTFKFTFKTKTQLPKTGLMIVGWGGHYGALLTASLVAKKHHIPWSHKFGPQADTIFGDAQTSFKNILPLVNPTELVLGGWDINDYDMLEAMKILEILSHDFQEKITPHVKDMKPLPSLYYENFILPSQEMRTDNVISGMHKWDHLEKIREDIKNFKTVNQLDKVIVSWGGAPERDIQVTKGVHDDFDNILNAIKNDHAEIPPSIIFAMASIMEGCSFISGNCRNVLVDGVINLACEKGTFLVSDDVNYAKSNMDEMLGEFLESCGFSLRPLNIQKNADSNFTKLEQHMKLISGGKTFESSSSSNSVDDDDLVDLLTKSKEAKLYQNLCKSLYSAVEAMVDLVLVTELFERIEWKTDTMRDFDKLNHLLILGYFPHQSNSTNPWPKQKIFIENIMRICAGIPIEA